MKAAEYQRIKRWVLALLGRAKELFVIIARGVSSDILAVLNDPELQAIAVSACRDAAARGLSGDRAWDQAFSTLTAALRTRGIELATNIAETLLQATYTIWKANGKP